MTKPEEVYLNWAGLATVLFCDVDAAKRWVARVKAEGRFPLDWNRQHGGFRLISVMMAIQFKTFWEFQEHTLFCKKDNDINE